MKAVFIDGPSLHHMGHAIGIAQFNLHFLHKLLAEEVGEKSEVVDQMVVTITPAMGKNAANAWTTAGFKVLQVTSANSADDLAIIERIAALGPQKVTQVILVTTDQDYIAVLRQKVQQGLKVCWVGLSVNGPAGTPLMSTSLKPFLGHEFEFFDLLHRKDELVGLPKKMPPAPKNDAPVRSLKVELSGAQNHADYMDFLTAMNRLLRKYPHIKYKIEG